MTPRALKPATTIDDQMTALEERGMKMDDALARQWLAQVSYYRLSAYWYPARILTEDGKRLDQFVENTRFLDAVDLYEADRKLRTIIHDGIERIEIALRTQIVNYLCLDNHASSLAYLDPDLFRPNFKHLDWVSTAYRRLARAQGRSDSVRHYSSQYGGQFPLWVVAETMDFSDISILYQGMKSKDQRAIAERLNLSIDLRKLSTAQADRVKKRHPLTNWLEQLSIIRNTCAHHGRLWNRSFVAAPTAALCSTGNLVHLPPDQSERIFGALVMMAHLLRTISPGTSWPEKVAGLLAESFLCNPLVDPESLGIPKGWDGQNL